MAKRSAPKAQDKLIFLLSLVPYLIDRERVTVDEAARHFSLPPQQIRDAVSLLTVSGVPGETHQYLSGDLFDIDWGSFEEDDEIVLTHRVALDDAPRFSAREASALIAGLQSLSRLPEYEDSDVIGGVMAKLARGASSTPGQVAVTQSHSDRSVGIIRSAIGTGHSVVFDYVNARGEHESRLVDPLRLESQDQDWYLFGWCHLREATRRFRLDRMTDLQVSELAVAPHDSSLVVPEALFEPSDSDLSVTVRLHSSVVPLIDDYVAAITRTDDATVTATLRVAHYHGLKRLVTSHPGLIEVLGPDEARRFVAAWAASALNRYSSPQNAPKAVDSTDDALNDQE
ncbi:helix-turn-helix transcriptional regulator [Plantibacter sp. Mn2098]|uniref:helix-turn-helix transcriptional regulator n=1 Tax=Plantibacter sp. Mn2098 TaxID=3395266 RepID=UPI003BCC08DE